MTNLAVAVWLEAFYRFTLPQARRDEWLRYINVDEVRRMVSQ